MHSACDVFRIDDNLSPPQVHPNFQEKPVDANLV